MMSQNPKLTQLENHLRDLINLLTQQRNENEHLIDELALSRQDFEAQTQKLNEAQTKIQTLSSQAAPIQKSEQENKLHFQEQRIQLLERERVNLREQIDFLQETMQNKETEWQTKLDSLQNNQDAQHQADEAQIVTLQTQLQEAEQKASQLSTQLDDVQQQSKIAQDDWQIKQTQLTEKRSN